MTTNKPLKQQIIEALMGEKPEDAERFAAYCQRIQMEKRSDNTPKNPWMAHKKAAELAQLFRRVKADGLVFDGKHVTLQSTGITYDYVAYKNKMLAAYPETKLDVGVVCEGDEFSFSKEDGVVNYTHKLADPFGKGQEIIGAYVVIKNERGEFLTTLNRNEIDKHRAVAKTDAIWKAWFKEMVLKTVLKKGVKYHFEDIFESMNEADNESIDLEQAIVPEVDAAKVKEVVDALEACKTLEELQAYFRQLAPEFIKNDEVFEAYTGAKSEFTAGKKGDAPATPAKPARAPAKKRTK